MSFNARLAKLIVRFFPKLAQRLIGSFYGYLKLPQLSYSLYGEDIVIYHFFKNIGLKNGVYVDIGAFHPKWISNTHLLSKKRWKGVVVDLEEYKLKPFKYFRSNCKTICAAVHPNAEIEFIDYYAFDRLLSEWDTTSKMEAEMRQKKSSVNYKRIKVQTITINEILRTTKKFTGGNCDYLNIDIEGMDESIIENIDFKVNKIKCIQFENNFFFAGTKKVQSVLSKNGYIHYASMGGTHTYVLANLLNFEK